MKSEFTHAREANSLFPILSTKFVLLDPLAKNGLYEILTMLKVCQYRSAKRGRKC